MEQEISKTYGEVWGDYIQHLGTDIDCSLVDFISQRGISYDAFRVWMNRTGLRVSKAKSFVRKHSVTYAAKVSAENKKLLADLLVSQQKLLSAWEDLQQVLQSEVNNGRDQATLHDVNLVFFDDTKVSIKSGDAKAIMTLLKSYHSHPALK